MAVQDLRAARRYATALFHIARQNNKLDVVEKDLGEIESMLRDSDPLNQVWHSPLIPAGKKGDLVGLSIEGRVDALTLSFVRLLISKRREGILEAVRQELLQLTDEERRLLRADAVFAILPTPEEQTALRESLQRRTGESVELTVKVDPAILGGVVVRMGDTILDGSVRGSLERIREQLLQEA